MLNRLFGFVPLQLGTIVVVAAIPIAFSTLVWAPRFVAGQTPVGIGVFGLDAVFVGRSTMADVRTFLDREPTPDRMQEELRIFAHRTARGRGGEAVNDNEQRTITTLTYSCIDIDAVRAGREPTRYPTLLQGCSSRLKLVGAVRFAFVDDKLAYVLLAPQLFTVTDADDLRVKWRAMRVNAGGLSTYPEAAKALGYTLIGETLRHYEGHHFEEFRLSSDTLARITYDAYARTDSVKRVEWFSYPPLRQFDIFQTL